MSIGPTPSTPASPSSGSSSSVPTSPASSKKTPVKIATPDLKSLNAVVIVSESRKKVEATFVWHTREIRMTVDYKEPIKSPKKGDIKYENSDEETRELGKLLLHKGMEEVNKTANEAFFNELKKKIMTKVPSFDIQGAKQTIHVEIREHSKPKEMGQLGRFEVVVDEILKPAQQKSQDSGNQKPDSGGLSSVMDTLGKHPDLIRDLKHNMAWDFAEENIEAFEAIQKIVTEIDHLTGNYQTDKKHLKKISQDFKDFWAKYENTLNFGADAAAARKKVVDKTEDLPKDKPELKPQDIIVQNTKLMKECMRLAEKAIGQNVLGVLSRYREQLAFRIDENTPISHRSSVSIKKPQLSKYSSFDTPTSPSSSSSSTSRPQSASPFSPKSPPTSPPPTPKSPESKH